MFSEGGLRWISPPGTTIGSVEACTAVAEVLALAGGGLRVPAVETTAGQMTPVGASAASLAGEAPAFR
ncbi:hypothetical protein GCM10009554_37270 [Kribbella koreensis]|uniref:Uncharacterized protein n=1 Tax=Kribbella koreensis TaxID=57909 RepID=A0ABP4B6N9_9ACTN